MCVLTHVSYLHISSLSSRVKMRSLVTLAVSVDDGPFKRYQGDGVCCVSAYAQRMRTKESPVRGIFILANKHFVTVIRDGALQSE